MHSLTHCTYLARCQGFDGNAWSLVMKERECQLWSFYTLLYGWYLFHIILSTKSCLIFFSIRFIIGFPGAWWILFWINHIMQMHTMQMITHLILGGILCKSCFPPHDFLLSFPPSLFSFSCSPVPLSLSRTFVVSRAESLAGSPGTALVSSLFYSFLLFTSESEYLNGASWVFSVQVFIFFYRKK